MGDFAAARVEYASVLSVDPTGNYARAARLNRAKLDADSGAYSLARSEYNDLLTADPADQPARRGRALLALREGASAQAEADLDSLLANDLTRSGRSDALASRALARLVLGHASEAAADADEAHRLNPSPAVTRLRTRARLALGRGDEIDVERPEDIEALPVGGPALRADLRRLAAALQAAAVSAPPAVEFRQRATRAVVLAALRDQSAVAEADRLIALAPLSSQGYRILEASYSALSRSYSRRKRADAARALNLEPGDPRLWELRGEIHVCEEKFAAALADPRPRARPRWRGAITRPPRPLLDSRLSTRGGRRMTGLPRPHDPDDPHAYLGRAGAFLTLKQWDQALADLEQAAGWADGRPTLLLRIFSAYGRCLPHRPEQAPRLVALLMRACHSAR